MKEFYVHGNNDVFDTSAKNYAEKVKKEMSGMENQDFGTD